MQLYPPVHHLTLQRLFAHTQLPIKAISHATAVGMSPVRKQRAYAPSEWSGKLFQGCHCCPRYVLSVSKWIAVMHTSSSHWQRNLEKTCKTARNCSYAPSKGLVYGPTRAVELDNSSVLVLGNGKLHIIISGDNLGQLLPVNLSFRMISQGYRRMHRIYEHLFLRPLITDGTMPDCRAL